jgi:nitric oxide reductase NorQ protein
MAKLNVSPVTEITPFGEIHGDDPALQDQEEENMSGGGRVAARNTTNQVRDYMWGIKDDQTSWGPGWRTNRNVYEDVTNIRQAGTSTQAIRRSLNWLVDQGLLEKDSSQEPEIFRWNPKKPFPGTPPKPFVPMKTGNPLHPPAAPVAAPVSPADRRAQLHNKLQGRMDEAKGKKEVKPKPEEKQARKGIIRKNGNVYLPRSLGGKDISDVEALRKLREANLFPLLYGPPGTGKSVLPEATFADELVIFEGNEYSGVDDLLGTYTQSGTGWTWVDGPALIAAREGRPLFLDDMTLVSPKVLAALYPLMDGRREIWVPQHMVDGKPDHVVAADGFWVIGAHNPGVHGAILTDALRSRFTVSIEVETDLELVAELKVPERFLRLTRNLRTKKKNNDIQWVPQLRELLAAKKTAEVFDENIAAANLAGIAPEEDRDIVIDMIRTIFGSDIKPLDLKGQI